MSKLCDRIYGSANLLATEEINGALCCPLCKKPAICHGKPVDQRAIYWALSDDTGISSKAIAKHMTGNSDLSGSFGMMPPSDASDRGRCIRLLELIPEWITRLPEMVKYDSQKQEGIVINNSGISAYNNSWQQQIPMILREGKF